MTHVQCPHLVTRYGHVTAYFGFTPSHPIFPLWESMGIPSIGTPRDHPTTPLKEEEVCENREIGLHPNEHLTKLREYC
jgi:hypothetical protein